MNTIEAAILFLLRHVAKSGDGPTATEAQKHLEAVEREFDMLRVQAAGMLVYDSQAVGTLHEDAGHSPD